MWRRSLCAAFLILGSVLGGFQSCERKGGGEEADAPPAAEPVPIPSAPVEVPATPEVSSDTESARVAAGRGDRMGAIRLFLPFRGTREGKDFGKVNAYLAVVSLGSETEGSHEKRAAVLVRRDSEQAVYPEDTGLEVHVDRELWAGRSVLDVKGVSSQDRWLTVGAFSQAHEKPEEAAPGSELFRLDEEMAVVEGGTAYLDVETGEKGWLGRDGERKPSAATPQGGLDLEAGDAGLDNVSNHRSAFSLAAHIGGFEEVTDLEERDGYLFFTTGYDQTLEIYDIRSLHSIRKVGSFSKLKRPKVRRSGTRFWKSEYFRLALTGSYALIVDQGYETEDNLLVVDISDKASPAFVVSLKTADIAHDLEIQGRSLYLATQSSVEVIDLSRLPTIEVTQSFKWDKGKCPCDVFDMDVYKGFAYVAAYPRGLVVLDLLRRTPLPPPAAGKPDSYVLALEPYRHHLILSEADATWTTSLGIRVLGLGGDATSGSVGRIPLLPHEAAIGLTVSDDVLYATLEPFPQDQPDRSLAHEVLGMDAVKAYSLRNITEPTLLDAYVTPRVYPAYVAAPYKDYLLVGTNKRGVLVLER